MKITDLKVWVTKPENSTRSFVFLNIETDQGITGIGEATSSGGGGSLIVGQMLRILGNTTITTDFRNSLLGENPLNIEHIWHKLYRRFTGGGGYGGFVTTLLSGVDIALWDIQGKVLGKPIYDLFGGTFRDKLPLYTHVIPDSPEASAEHAKQLVSNGFKAMKTDPFFPEMQKHHRNYIEGSISVSGAIKGIETIASIREAVGDSIEILVDAHGNFNVPTAIHLGNRLEEYHITWFEEPVQPDSNEALRQVKESVNVPISVGERLYTRWGFVPILKDRLTDYIMPDILWTGGITELRKISILAEPFYIPVSPHDANGPINIVAGAHVMMTIPNFYKLEYSTSLGTTYNKLITEPLDIENGFLHLSKKPGLGIELDIDYIEANPDPDWE